MSRRNIDKAIEKLKVNPYYELTLSEIQQLREEAQGDTIFLVIKAFKYGYAMGRKATLSEIKKQAEEQETKGL